jgi:hypothetical protein
MNRTEGSPEKSSGIGDIVWIFATIVFYFLASGASPYIKSFFMAGYLK